MSFFSFLFFFPETSSVFFTSASLAGKIQVILLSTALVLALPKEQDLGWISARRAASGRVAAPALAAASCGKTRKISVIPDAPADCTSKNGVILQPCYSSCPLWGLQSFCLLCSFSHSPKCKESHSVRNRLECPLTLLLTLLRTGQVKTLTLSPNPQIRAFPVPVSLFPS